MGDPWFKFYPRDWRGDQALRAVSVAARGLWMECLCIMHEAKPYGHLVLNGEPVDGGTLARMTGTSVDEATVLMAELRQAGVLSVTGRGVIFSRRMTKDHARAQKGRKSANKRWSQVPDGVEQSGAPNGLPNREPITQKPEARSQKAATQLAGERKKSDQYDDLLNKLLEANGIGAGFREERNPGLLNVGPILVLIEGGVDLDKDILPAIRANPKPKARTWQYLVPQIEEYALKRRGLRERLGTLPPAAQIDWASRLDVWRRDDYWPHAWGPKPGEKDCKVPAHLIEQEHAA